MPIDKDCDAVVVVVDHLGRDAQKVEGETSKCERWEPEGDQLGTLREVGEHLISLQLAAGAFARAYTVTDPALLAWIVLNNARKLLNEPRSWHDFVERPTTAE